MAIEFMSNFDVTVVVCSYNRADSLKDALGSLTDLQTDGRFTYEVLVINNASTDHTQDAVSYTHLTLPTKA